MQFIRDLGSYLRAVFFESQRWVFTAFDLIGIVLFFFPNLTEYLGQNVAIARQIGLIIFVLSFIAANFALYRKLISSASTAPIKHTLLIHPYIYRPYNDVELRYLGTEPITDLHILLIYKDSANQIRQKTVEEFFPQDDPTLFWRQFKANVLDDNQVIRFHTLLFKKDTSDGKVTLEVSAVGARSGTHVKYRKELQLEL